MDAEFWKSKSVFLTGHTGFKGSWMALWLQNLGARVVGYALSPPSEPSLFEVGRVADGMVSIDADVRDLDLLRRSMTNHQPDIVIHMAAQALVRYSYEHPVENYATNVMGTVNVLEAVRNTPCVRSVVVVTSDKCYENREWLWSYRENEAMGGYDPYSSSKGCAELATAAYRRSFFNEKGNKSTSVASVRAGNVIGGGDWAADRLIPDILRGFTGNRPVTIRNPLAIRPWQHVLEPISGYLLLARKLYEQGSAYAEGWNFGPSEDDAKPVQWIVERLADLWGETARWEKDGADHPHEAHYLKLDCSKSRMRLGWKPKWTLAEALNRIIAWHKAYQSGEDMRDYSLSQIADYEEQPSK